MKCSRLETCSTGPNMSDTLVLKLDLVRQTADGLRFRLQMRNTSSVKILAPRPVINCLHFGDLATGKPALWHTKLRESGSWTGYFYDSGEVHETEYQVRPSSVAPPAGDNDSEFARCSLDLVPGSYLVWLKLQVDEDYFCGDSHYRYPDLVWLAAPGKSRRLERADDIESVQCEHSVNECNQPSEPQG